LEVIGQTMASSVSCVKVFAETTRAGPELACFQPYAGSTSVQIRCLASGRQTGVCGHRAHAGGSSAWKAAVFLGFCRGQR
jgi:hypothetical protein